MDKRRAATNPVFGRFVCGMTIEGSLIEENPRGGPSHNVPLGTLVLRAGLMPQQRIEAALRESVANGRKLGEMLVRRGLRERDLVRLLAAQHAQPFVDLTHFPIDWDAARMLPPPVAQAQCALPIAQDGEEVTVAVPDPDDGRQRERLQRALRRHIRLVAAARQDIKAAIHAVTPRESVARPGSYDVLASLVSGKTVRVGQRALESEAQILADRVIARARVGALVATLEDPVDGADVVSVEIAPGAARP